MARRLKGMGQAKYQRDGDPKTSGPGFGITEHPGALDIPTHWRKPQRIFVNSMSDLFHPGVTGRFISEVFGVMAASPQHTFQVLTKRHARLRSLLSESWFRNAVADYAAEYRRDGWVNTPWPLPNVHLGVSAEDQSWADIRIPALLETPAAVRWVSAEPLLDPLDLLDPYLIPADGCPCESGTDYCAPTLDWVVLGGESGPGARPMDLAWAERIVKQCQEASCPVFVKQLGSVTGGKSHQDVASFPASLQVRQYPAVTS
jgi:protein gp37